MNQIIHFAVLTVLLTACILIGYVMFNEAFNRDYEGWNKDKRK